MNLSLYERYMMKKKLSFNKLKYFMFFLFLSCGLELEYSEAIVEEGRGASQSLARIIASTTLEKKYLNKVTVGQNLLNIFGNNAGLNYLSIKKHVYLKANFFSPGCDNYNYVKDDSRNLILLEYSCETTRCTSSSCVDGFKGGSMHLQETSDPLGIMSVGRIGQMIKACDEILSRTESIQHALSLVSLTTSSELSHENLDRAYQLFFPTEVDHSSSHTQMIQHLDPSFHNLALSGEDSWKFVFTVLCVSPDWHVL